MPIYMKIKGIDGTVQEQSHSKWISVDSCDFEVTREVTEGTGAAKNREWKAPTVGAMNFAKKVDDVSGPLARWSMGEPSKETIEIHMVRLGPSGKYETYLEYKLAACILSKYDYSADDSPEEKGSENFSISYLSIEIIFREYDQDGSVKPPSTVAYDLRSGKKSFVAAV